MARRTLFVTLVASFLAARSPIQAASFYVRTSAELQSALTAAQPGDTILLEPGLTYLGNFVLPVKPGETFITIRSAASDAVLPPEGIRISPSDAPLLPRLRSPNSGSVLTTAAGAHHWRLQYLEFGPNVGGYGDIMQLGHYAQTTLAAVPYSIELDHVYIHGDRLLGQKRGISLNAAAVTIRDSYIADCKAVGQDAQAIAGWNGPGPYLIENSYLEGAGENFLLGGADPAIPGLIPSDVTFRRNYVAHPVSWRDPILAAPVGIGGSEVPGGGLLAPGTYAYRVVARRPSGQGTTARSTASAEGTVVVGSSGSGVQVQWSAVPDAAEYLVYGRTPGAQGTYWTTTATSFVDTGSGGTAGAVPTSPGTVWIVKNLFELKNARRVVVEGNTFENNWQGAQPGYAILFTTRNSNKTCNWCAVEDVEFRYNIVRHSAAGINVLGYDDTAPSGQTRNIRIRHNLFYDISNLRWGGNGWGILLGEEPRDIIIDHNTIDHSGTTVLYAYGGTATDPREIYGLQFTNNMTRHNAYGIHAASQSYGNGAIAAYFPDGIVTANLLAGGSPTRYPPGNYFNNDFDAQFMDPANGDYRLVPGSPYRTLSTDGVSLGADVQAILNQPPTEAPPAAPSGLTATANSSSQITLTWNDNSTNEQTFRVERCQGLGCAAFAEIASAGVNVNTYVDGGLAAGTLYRYRVRASGATQFSNYSAVAEATTASAPPPNNPPTANAGGPYTGAQGQAITFDGSASSDPDGDSLTYNWDFGDGSAGVSTTSPTTSHTYTVAGTYTVRLTVSDAVVTSTASVTSATVASLPSGGGNDIYVWDIVFESRTRGKGGSIHDERIYVTVRRDSDTDGVAELSDQVVSGVSVTVDLTRLPSTVIGSASGTTNTSGVFVTGWFTTLANGTYRADVRLTPAAPLNWKKSLDQKVDSDGNGLPDAQHTIPH
jgi:PKD repeat protein